MFPFGQNSGNLARCRVDQIQPVLFRRMTPVGKLGEWLPYAAWRTPATPHRQFPLADDEGYQDS